MTIILHKNFALLLLLVKSIIIISYIESYFSMKNLIFHIII